jgi:ElaB/YqjD/DUF883 family membrane-anchored ribosome-binding protein
MAHDDSGCSDQLGQRDGCTDPFSEQRVNGLDITTNDLIDRQSTIRRLNSSPLDTDYKVPNPLADLAVGTGEIINQAARNLGSAIDSSPIASELAHKGEEFLGNATRLVSVTTDRVSNVADELRLQATEEITERVQRVAGASRDRLSTTVDSAIQVTQQAVDDFVQEHPDFVDALNQTTTKVVGFLEHTARSAFSSLYQRAEQIGDSIVDFFEDSPADFPKIEELPKISDSVGRRIESDKYDPLPVDHQLSSTELLRRNVVDDIQSNNYASNLPGGQTLSNVLEAISGVGLVSWKNRIPVENGGVINGAQYAQNSYSTDFSKEGKFGGWTVSQLQEAIIKEHINLSEVPVEYVVRDGKVYILNTRSSTALGGSGIPRDLWHVENKTGEFGQWKAEDRLTRQLGRNPIPEGTNIRQPYLYPMNKIPKEPISPGALKALEFTGKTTKAIESVGKVAAPIAIAFDGYRLIDAYQKDGNGFGHNFQTTTGSVAGGWTGALVGAELGAQGGAALGGAIGIWFGGVGAVPGAAIGGVVGGLAGGAVGAFTGSEFGEWIGSGEAAKCSSTTFDNINRAVSDAFRDTNQKVSETSAQAIQSISNTVQDTNKKVAETTHQASNVVQEQTKKAVQAVNEVGQTALNTVQDTTKKTSEVADQAVQNVSNTVQDTTKKVAEATHQASNVVQEQTKKAAQAVNQVGQTALNTVQDTTKKTSEVADQAVQNVSNIVQDTTKKVAEATHQTGQEVSNAIQDVNKKVSETVNQAEQKVSESYKKTTQWLGGLFGGGK